MDPPVTSSRLKRIFKEMGFGKEGKEDMVPWCTICEKGRDSCDWKELHFSMKPEYVTVNRRSGSGSSRRSVVRTC